MILNLFFATWLIMNGYIISVLTNCCMETLDSVTSNQVLIVSCIDVSGESFVYDTDTVKKLSAKSEIYIEIKNITIPNSFIINTLVEISVESSLKGVRIINNLTDGEVEYLIAKIPNLNSLNVTSNHLNNLPKIPDGSQLEILYLENNNINHLYSNYDLKKLLQLVISSCNISYIHKNAFGAYNGILKVLDLSNNKIKSLNSALNKVCGLEFLDLSNNLLEYINQSDICRSSFIHLQGNKLLTASFEFQPYFTSNLWMDVLQIGSLNNSTFILAMQFRPYADGYEIEDAKALDRIETLREDSFQPRRKYQYKHESAFYLENISVSEILPNAFRGLRDKQKISLRYNNINVLQNYVFNGSVLSVVDLSFSNISSIEANAFYGTTVHVLYLSHNLLSEMNPNIFCNTEVSEVDLSFNNLEKFEYLACENYIKKLSLQFNYISSIDNLGVFLELTHLNVSSNQISNLSEHFGNSFPSLEYLDLSDNMITELAPNTFIALKRLRFLSLEDNVLTKIDPSAFTFEAFDFEYLILSYEGVIEAGHFSRLPRLKNLTFANSKITLLKNGGFRGLARLQSLIFKNVIIERIVTGCFSGLVNLKEADFSNILRAQTFLISGFFEGLDSITNLNISRTEMKLIQYNAFSGAPKLVSLILSHNNISSLEAGSFFNLQNLEYLYLDHNQLSKLNIGVFSGFRNLTVLDLSHNLLQVLKNDVMFPIMESLRYLNLQGNKLMELDHEELIKINRGELYINISDNLWKCQYLLHLLGNFTLGNIGYKVEDNFVANKENIDGIYCVDICKFVYCENISDEYHPN